MVGLAVVRVHLSTIPTIFVANRNISTKLAPNVPAPLQDSATLRQQTCTICATCYPAAWMGITAKWNLVHLSESLKRSRFHLHRNRSHAAFLRNYSKFLISRCGSQEVSIGRWVLFQVVRTVRVRARRLLPNYRRRMALNRVTC